LRLTAAATDGRLRGFERVLPQRCVMRTWILLGLLAGVALVAGCATVAKTPEENWATYRQIADLDTREIGDDWNLIWLADRQTRLTKWHVR